MNYGRGHVESYLGDLKSLEGLSRSILEGSSASAKMLLMVNPSGTTRASALAKAPNGAIIEVVQETFQFYKPISLVTLE